MFTQIFIFKNIRKMRMLYSTQEKFSFIFKLENKFETNAANEFNKRI